jgi:hypothetical protein
MKTALLALSQGGLSAQRAILPRKGPGRKGLPTLDKQWLCQEGRSGGLCEPYLAEIRDVTGCTWLRQS